MKKIYFPCFPTLFDIMEDYEINIIQEGIFTPSNVTSSIYQITIWM